MKRIILLLMLSVTPFLGFAQDSYPVTWSFSSEKINKLMYKIKCRATIKEPYHIYPQSSEGGLGIPTEFSFVENPDVAFIGTMDEKGVEQKDGESLPYYAKGAIFTQTVKLKTDKKTTLEFSIKFQACTNQMCLLPTSKQFSIILNE